MSLKNNIEFYLVYMAFTQIILKIRFHLDLMRLTVEIV